MLEILLITVDLFWALMMIVVIGHVRTNDSAVLAGITSILMALNAMYIVFT